LSLGEVVQTYSIAMAPATGAHDPLDRATIQTYQQCGLHSMCRYATTEEDDQFTNASNVQTT